MRIIAISIVSILAVGILLLTARIWGLGQNYAVYEHSFFNSPPPFVIVKVESLESAQEVLKLKPDAILWLDVRFSRDQINFVLPTVRDVEFLDYKTKLQAQNPAVPIMIGARVAEYPWSEIKEFYKTPSTLEEFYTQFPQTRFVLNVIDNVSEAHHILVKALQALHPNKRTLIQSEALLLLRTIKELKPEWVYGTSKPDLMRLLTFDSLYITPSIQFMGDVFIAPFTLMKRPAFNDDIISEMRRRHKRIFLGPIKTSDQLHEAQKLNSEGYITDNLPELLNLLGQGPAQ